jgi:hypothetical protein
LLVIEGALLGSFDLWAAMNLSAQPLPPAVVAILVAIAVLIGVLALAGTVLVRGFMVMRRPRRPVASASLRLQVLVVTVLFGVWLTGVDGRLTALGLGVVAATALALSVGVLLHPD